MSNQSTPAPTLADVSFPLFYVVTASDDIVGPVRKGADPAPTGHVALFVTDRPAPLYFRSNLPTFSTYSAACEEIARRFEARAAESAEQAKGWRLAARANR